MQLYVKANVPIKSICSGARWQDRGESFYMEDPEFDEWIEINKTTRAITNYGFTRFVEDLKIARFVTYEDESLILRFPHTIGDITFKSRQHLEEWVISANKTIKEAVNIEAGI